MWPAESIHLLMAGFAAGVMNAVSVLRRGIWLQVVSFGLVSVGV
jgi:hypothetical protein